MTRHLLILSVLMAAVGGCDNTQIGTDQKAVHVWLINTVNDTAMRNAIVRQRTLFPYHFDVNAATLNELGQHDLAVLAGHYMQHPGNINIRRGGAPKQLYDARVATVTGILRNAGIDTRRMKATDLPAGGDGIASEEVLVIVEGKQDGAKAAPSATIGVAKLVGE